MTNPTTTPNTKQELREKILKIPEVWAGDTVVGIEQLLTDTVGRVLNEVIGRKVYVKYDRRNSNNEEYAFVSVDDIERVRKNWS